MHERLPAAAWLIGVLLVPWAFRACPHAMRPFFASHAAGGFHGLGSCLVPEWAIACLCLPGLFKSALTYILRAFYSAVIGINTASYDASCKEPTCFVPEHVASSVYRFDPGSASDPVTADSLQYVSTQPAPVVIQHECVHLKFLYAYETPTCLLTHFAVTLSMYTLLLTIYRALLKRCSFSVEKSIANSCVRARLAYS